MAQLSFLFIFLCVFHIDEYIFCQFLILPGILSFYFIIEHFNLPFIGNDIYIKRNTLFMLTC